MPPQFGTRFTTLCLHNLCLGYRTRASGSTTVTTSGDADVSRVAIVDTSGNINDIVAASVILAAAFISVSVCAMAAMLATSGIRRAVLSFRALRDARTARRFAAIAKVSPAVVGRGEDGRCVICLEEMRRGCVIRKLTCLHAFHAACVDGWVVGGGECCPICKRGF